MLLAETHEERNLLNNPEQDAFLGMEQKQVEKYSILKAIRARLQNNPDLSPLETEASDEVIKKLGTTGELNRFSIPQDVLQYHAQRDLNVGTATAGGNLVATDLLSMIDLLRNRMMVNQMGATIIPGLVGNVAFPRQTGSGSAFWVAEDGTPSESEGTVDQVAMSPKTVGAFTDLTRKLILQTNHGAEAFVRQDLMSVIALAIDLAAINGSGTGNEPTGIMNVSGIGAVVGGTNGAVPTYADMIDLETQVAQDNADIGSLGYLTNQKVRGKLKSTEKASSTGHFVWENGGQPGVGLVNGYNAGVSNQVPSTLTKGTSGATLSAIIFGNWADLLIGQWGTLSVLVDPYTSSTKGGVRIVVFHDIDIAVRHPESFSVMQDAITV